MRSISIDALCEAQKKISEIFSIPMLKLQFPEEGSINLESEAEFKDFQKVLFENGFEWKTYGKEVRWFDKGYCSLHWYRDGYFYYSSKPTMSNKNLFTLKDMQPFIKDKFYSV